MLICFSKSNLVSYLLLLPNLLLPTAFPFPLKTHSLGSIIGLNVTSYAVSRNTLLSISNNELLLFKYSVHSLLTGVKFCTFSNNLFFFSSILYLNNHVLNYFLHLLLILYHQYQLHLCLQFYLL